MAKWKAFIGILLFLCWASLSYATPRNLIYVTDSYASLNLIIQNTPSDSPLVLFVNPLTHPLDRENDRNNNDPQEEEEKEEREEKEEKEGEKITKRKRFSSFFLNTLDPYDVLRSSNPCRQRLSLKVLLVYQNLKPLYILYSNFRC